PGGAALRLLRGWRLRGLRARRLCTGCLRPGGRGRLLGRRLGLRRLASAGSELESHVAVGAAHQECGERTALARDEPVQQVGLAGREQLLDLLALDRALQDDAPGAEIATPLGADAVLARVRHRLLEHPAAALRARAERRVSGEVDLLLGFGLAEIELGLELRRELHHGGERLAEAAAETLERTDRALGHELLDLLGGELAARYDLPDREVALLALELAVVLLDLSSALRARCLQRQERRVRNLAV